MCWNTTTRASWYLKTHPITKWEKREKGIMTEVTLFKGMLRWTYTGLYLVVFISLWIACSVKVERSWGWRWTTKWASPPFNSSQFNSFLAAFPFSLLNSLAFFFSLSFNLVIYFHFLCFTCGISSPLNTAADCITSWFSILFFPFRLLSFVSTAKWWCLVK